MSGTPPYGEFQAIAIRVAKLDATGKQVAGAKNGYYTKAVIDVSPDLDIQTGAKDTLTRGDGQVCATSQDNDIILRSKCDLNLCNLDAALIHLATGAQLFEDAGVAAGFQVLGTDDDAPNGVCLELWAKAWDNDVQATATVLSSANTYWHSVWPNYKGQLAKRTVNAKHNAVPITGSSASNSNITANGPYDDWPLYIAQAGGITKPYGVFLDTLPDLTEGYQVISVSGS